MIPAIFVVLDFFVLLRSFSTCSINFSSTVGSFDANSSFLGCDANSSFLGCDAFLVCAPQLVQNVFPSKILLPHLLHEFEISFDNLLSVLGLICGSLVFALTSVILNDDSVDFSNSWNPSFFHLTCHLSMPWSQILLN